MASAVARTVRLGRRPTSAAPHIRTSLLDAATSLFAERGVAATTMATIAARTGVTAAMVHYYFRSRDQLVDAVVAERIGPIALRVWAPIPGRAAAPLEVVPVIVRRVLKCVDAMPWLPPLWVREVISEGGHLRERMLAHLPTGQIKHFALDMAAAQKRGRINADVEPRLIFITIFGLTMLLLATYDLRARLLETGDIDQRSLERHLIAILTDGLAGRRRGKS